MPPPVRNLAYPIAEVRQSEPRQFTDLFRSVSRYNGRAGTSCSGVNPICGLRRNDDTRHSQRSRH